MAIVEQKTDVIEAPSEGQLPKGMLIPSGVVSIPRRDCEQVSVVVVNKTNQDIIVEPGQKVADLVEVSLVVTPPGETKASEIDPGRFNFGDSPVTPEWKKCLRVKLCKRSKVLLTV